MRLELAARSLELLTASAVDVLSARGQPGPLPYWAVAWPAGLALARHLSGLPLANARVLELGCGVGVSGLGAALAGGKVLLTDCERWALRLAQINSRQNGLRLHALAADWRHWPIVPTSRTGFDLVIGSDVTYELEAFPVLLSVLRTVAGPRTEVLLTDPCRLVAEGFRKAALESGWHVRASLLPDESRQKIRLLTLSRHC
jgi:predicted nicotinamide N-methyase